MEDNPLPGTIPSPPRGTEGRSGTGPSFQPYDGKGYEFKPVKGPELMKDEISTLSFSFQTWCMSLTRWVLSAKTAFSKYLASTLRLCRDGPQSSPTALFPLPLPSFAPYAAWVPGGPRRKKRELAINRALHVLVCALNYVYMASSFPPLDLIRRQPNKVQSQALENLRLLLQACDQDKPIHVESSGRKNLLLLSRLQELAQAVDALGLSSSPYHTGRQGLSVPADNTKHPKLSPFGSLQSDRLKISGCGQWNAVSYMPPEFQMGYLEPQLLELDAPVYTRGKPNLENESPQEVLKLFKRWDSFGLLALHPASHLPEGPEKKVKIFNAYKSEEWDRQIGDRRLQNAYEARLPGPSKDLPCGPLITRLILPEGHGVKVCVTDRSDFYHQMAATYERSRTNAVWPPLKLGELQGTQAYDDYMARAAQAKKPPDRTVHGDLLNGIRPWKFETEPDSQIFGSFQSVLQGDHLGVEFGIASHVGFLQEQGLLLGRGRLQTSSLVRPTGLYEGLVTDDYFTIAPVPLQELRSKKVKPSKAHQAFITAKQAYAQAGLAGSDAKDVVDQSLATVVGAELDSRPSGVQSGTLPVGAPALKRLSLSWVALQAARFAYTTDALHSSMMGALVSACCFRKCTMAIFQELFKVISPQDLDTDHPKLRVLPRKASDELVLAGVLLPVMASNIMAQVSTTIFCSDASTGKGAFCEAQVDKRVAEALWQSGDFKGGHVILDTMPKSILRSHAGVEVEDWEREEEDSPFFGHCEAEPTAERPLAQFYDFLEACGGSGVISDAMSKKGYVVGPIIDLTYSIHYDLTKSRTVEWLLFLVQNGRVRSLALEPPCTTFSAAAHPMVRSYRCPRGFNQKASKVWLGNRLAFACMTLLLASLFAGIFALLETPRRSKMAWLQEWQRLLEFEGIEEVFTASCSFGSAFQKEFRFLTANMKPNGIKYPCTRDHQHVRIEGVLTKGSAVYCPRLAQALADLFADHLNAQTQALHRASIDTEGLESVLVNEVAKKAEWQVSSSWRWKGFSHINILELASVLQVVKRAARLGGGRFSLLIDSFVALRSSSKGRSSSKALAPLLKKLMAVSLAFAVYLSGLFCPTRLNPSDDPTRDVPLRTPQDQPFIMDFLDLDGLYSLAEMPRLRRWASNWAGLVLGLLSWARELPLDFLSPSYRLRSSGLPLTLHEVLRDFDSTKGYPGEGPHGTLVFVAFLAIGAVAAAMEHELLLEPRHMADQARAELRATRPLEYGRPVLDVTRSSREKLLRVFATWLEKRGFALEDLLRDAPKDPSLLVRLLTDYGMKLYTSGRPYNHFAETINGLGALQPPIRRLMSGAWDLCFAWLREEPYEHHIACPYQVMLATLTLSVLWGWPRVAAAIALCWGSICRIGEILAATRRDLILPDDMGGSIRAIMLRVGEPKTRFRAARHQLARMDWEDLVIFCEGVFSKLEPWEKLWSASPQVLRTRFKQLLLAMGLPTVHGPEGRPLDLGSLRAGGATHLLMVTEDSELVRRRGRWLSARTMEIYIQESSSATFLPQLPVQTKDRILNLALAFPEAMEKMRHFEACHLPCSTWPYFFRGQSDPKNGKKMGGGGRQWSPELRDTTAKQEERKGASG